MRMWKKITLGVAVSTVAVASLFAVYLFLGGFDLARPPDDADLLLPDPEPVPDDENAYVAFLTLTNLWSCSDMASRTNFTNLSDEMLVRYYAFQVVGDSARTNAYEAFSANRALMAEYADRILSENERFLTAFYDVARMERFQSPDWLEVIKGNVNVCAVPVFDYYKLLFCPRFLYGLRIQRAIEKRAFQSAMADCEMLAAFSRHVDIDTGFFNRDHLACHWYYTLAVLKMTHLALADGIPDTLFERIEKWLADSEPLKADIDLKVKRIYSMGRKDLMGITKDDFRLLSVRNGVALWLFDWPGGFRFAFHRNATLAQMAGWAHHAIRGETFQITDDLSCFAINKYFFEFMIPNWFGKTIAPLLPNPEQVNSCLQSDQFLNRAARLSLAAAKWRKANGGGFPPTLEVLVPTCIDAVPADPYDPAHPLRYHPETGMVWSVGPDRSFDYEQVLKSEDGFRGTMRRYVYRLDGMVHL